MVKKNSNEGLPWHGNNRHTNDAYGQGRMILITDIPNTVYKSGSNGGIAIGDLPVIVYRSGSGIAIADIPNTVYKSGSNGGIAIGDIPVHGQVQHDTTTVATLFGVGPINPVTGSTVYYCLRGSYTGSDETGSQLITPRKVVFKNLRTYIATNSLNSGSSQTATITLRTGSAGGVCASSPLSITVIGTQTGSFNDLTDVVTVPSGSAFDLMVSMATAYGTNTFYASVVSLEYWS